MMKNKNLTIPFFSLFLMLFFVQCKEKKQEVRSNKDKVADISVIKEKPDSLKIPEGMVWVPGGVYMQGAVAGDEMAMHHEKPAHKVAVDGFFMDITEVTNAEFQEFIDATGYKTVAERPINWEEMKKNLPPGTPKPPDSILQPGSLIFKKVSGKVENLMDYSQWWQWKIGANWKHPKGPESSIEGKGNMPVVHIALEDALAYCKWAGKRLPTEAEWEYAARGGKEAKIYFWGNNAAILKERANSWQGDFPNTNLATDGYSGLAPVKSYPPNAFGIYDMAGNVWEWTSDWYNVNYYANLAKSGKTALNPQGAEKAYNPNNPRMKEKVIRGGSFLCHASYCASYRNSARMATSTDSGLEHLGFRTVVGVEDL